MKSPSAIANQLDEILDKLEKPIPVERKMGYRDLSVIGGFGRYMQLWASRAMELAEGDSEVTERLRYLVSLFDGYELVSLMERKERVNEAEQIVKELRSLIKNELRVNERIGSPDEEVGTTSSVSVSEDEHLHIQTAVASKGVHTDTVSTDIYEQKLKKLSQPVQYLYGVGQKRASLLKRLGVETVEDLLMLFPRRHEDRTRIKPIAQLTLGEKECALVTVTGHARTEKRRGIAITKVPVADHTGSAFLVWFNQPFREAQVFPNMKLFVYGKVQRFMHSLCIVMPEVEPAVGDSWLQVGRIVPIYPLTGGLTQNFLRRLIYNTLEAFSGMIEETLPQDLLRAHQMMPLREAFKQIHFPDDMHKLQQARRRVVFEEFLLMQLALALRERGFKKKQGIAFKTDLPQIAEFIASFPFELTASQKRAIEEIHRDMASPQPMNRLLHGEVGSGKTVVAATALYTAVLNGYQGAFMAPTEVLAEQHYRVLLELFQPFNVDVTLLIGSLSQREKRRARRRIEIGDASIIVGTHALIQEDVVFNRLGLAVVDEQHKFGVMQRANLIRKGTCPDVLIMTATPIPRTLALTVYGDLDVSVLRELPPGRKPVITRWVRKERRHLAYRFVQQELEKGRQAYVVCPLIEESEKLEDVDAVVKHAEWLQHEVFPDFKVGVLHGRLPSHEKDAVMEAFRRGEIHVLTTTTVIEVGVDVPNATVIVIEDAHRFGLAQLHQLRGRVGRSTYQSYCFLVGSPSSEDARRRLEVMVRTNDGFEIAEEDLRLRGPGEFYGTRQHGLPDLRIADIIHDVDLLILARRVARSIVEEDPTLRSPKYAALRQKVLKLFEGRIELIDVS
jgi:ATP-dependent DNA helicase RecG